MKKTAVLLSLLLAVATLSACSSDSISGGLTTTSGEPPVSTSDDSKTAQRTDFRETTVPNTDARSPQIEPLTDEEREEIEAAWLAHRGRALDWEDNIRYYGMYGDCRILFDAGAGYVEQETVLTVADYQFFYPTGFVMWVYHDGQLILLSEAYESGLLTKEQIAEIAQTHWDRLAEMVAQTH